MVHQLLKTLHILFGCKLYSAERTIYLDPNLSIKNILGRPVDKRNRVFPGVQLASLFMGKLNNLLPTETQKEKYNMT